MKKLLPASKSYSNGFVFKILVFCLLVLCIAPTSIGGDFSKVPTFYGLANICFVLVFGFLYGVLNKHSVLMVSVLIFLYISFTAFTPLFEYSFGHSISVLPILTLICFRFKNLPVASEILWVYYLVVFLVFIIGYLATFFPSLTSVYEAYYAYGYENLISALILRGKPISIFGSHSYAGFFYFLFSILSWHLLSNKRNIFLNTFILLISFYSLILIDSGSSKFFRLSLLCTLLLIKLY